MPLGFFWHDMPNYLPSSYSLMCLTQNLPRKLWKNIEFYCWSISRGKHGLLSLDDNKPFWWLWCLLPILINNFTGSSFLTVQFKNGFVVFWEFKASYLWWPNCFGFGFWFGLTQVSVVFWKKEFFLQIGAPTTPPVQTSIQRLKKRTTRVIG